MLIAILGFGILAGLASATWTLVAGGTVLAALGSYMLYGTLAVMISSVAVALSPDTPLDADIDPL